MPVLRTIRDLLIKRHPVFTGCADCPERHIPWRALRAALPAPSFPIDIVFTWVDGDDPTLIEKRNAWLAAKHQSPATRPAAPPDAGGSHHRNNDELRFALRSIARYAPWVRRVFIVADGQSPHWLNREHPRVRVVDHTEFIPDEYLPTFSSRVIEAHLHRIPGLGEHFIYCNDDFFLIESSDPRDFFTAAGLPFLFVDWRASRRAGYQAAQSLHALAYANVLEYLARHGVIPTPDIITAHVHYPLSKKLMRDAYTFYEEAVRRFARNRFRTAHDMVFPCHAVPLWAYALKRAVPRDMPYYYLNAKRFDRSAYYAAMLREKDKGTLPPFLCINDVGEASAKHTWRADMQAFLQAFYPEPSPFENSEEPTRDLS